MFYFCDFTRVYCRVMYFDSLTAHDEALVVCLSYEFDVDIINSIKLSSFFVFEYYSDRQALRRLVHLVVRLCAALRDSGLKSMKFLFFSLSLF